MQYQIETNGTMAAFCVIGATRQEAQDELLSLQNKSIATRQTVNDQNSFSFVCSKRKLKKAFIRQWIQKHWLDDEFCKKFKGVRGGFYNEAEEYANNKLANMQPVKDIRRFNRENPNFHFIGEVKAEKPSDDWNDYLTKQLEKRHTTRK